MPNNPKEPRKNHLRVRGNFTGTWTLRTSAEWAAWCWYQRSDTRSIQPLLRNDEQYRCVELDVLKNALGNYSTFLIDSGRVAMRRLTLAVLADNILLREYVRCCLNAHDTATDELWNLVVFAQALLAPRTGLLQQLPLAEQALRHTATGGEISQRMARHIKALLDFVLGGSRTSEAECRRHPLLAGPQNAHPDSPVDVESAWMFFCEQSYTDLHTLRRELEKLGPPRT